MRQEQHGHRRDRGHELSLHPGSAVAPSAATPPIARSLRSLRARRAASAPQAMVWQPGARQARGLEQFVDCGAAAPLRLANDLAQHRGQRVRVLALAKHRPARRDHRGVLALLVGEEHHALGEPRLGLHDPAIDVGAAAVVHVPVGDDRRRTPRARAAGSRRGRSRPATPRSRRRRTGPPSPSSSTGSSSASSRVGRSPSGISTRHRARPRAGRRRLTAATATRTTSAGRVIGTARQRPATSRSKSGGGSAARNTKPSRRS